MSNALIMAFVLSQSITETPQLVFADEILAFPDTVRVISIDNATDGCWTNASTVETRARYLLELADIPTNDSDDTATTIRTPELQIGVVASRSQGSGSCYGVVTVRLQAYTISSYFDVPALNWGRWETIHRWDWRSINGRNFNDLALRSTEEAVQEFVTLRLQHRRALDARGVVYDRD